MTVGFLKKFLNDVPDDKKIIIKDCFDCDKFSLKENDKSVIFTLFEQQEEEQLSSFPLEEEMFV